MNRYLTPDEKAETVEHWLSYRKTCVEIMPPNSGGTGYPDPEVFELTDRINEIEGVCTVQSCSGHRHQDLNAEEPSLWSGQLWLRVDRGMMERAVDRVYELTDQKPNIERVQVIFDRDGDILDIQFAGLNVSCEALEESGRIIVDFLKARAREVIQ